MITKSAHEAVSSAMKFVTGEAHASWTCTSYLVTISGTLGAPGNDDAAHSRLMMRLISVRSSSNVMDDLLSLPFPVTNCSTKVLFPHPCSPITLIRNVLTTNLSWFCGALAVRALISWESESNRCSRRRYGAMYPGLFGRCLCCDAFCLPRILPLVSLLLTTRKVWETPAAVRFARAPACPPGDGMQADDKLRGGRSGGGGDHCNNNKNNALCCATTTMHCGLPVIRTGSVFRTNVDYSEDWVCLTLSPLFSIF